VQLATVGVVGAFLADRADVPGDVVECVAVQLDVAAATMATYTQREKTRLSISGGLRARSATATSSDAEAELAV